MMVTAPATQDCHENETMQNAAARTVPGRVSASGLGYGEDEADSRWRRQQRA